MTSSLSDDIDLSVLKIYKDEQVLPEDIVPRHLAEELVSIRVMDNRSCWRKGDIELEVERLVAQRGLAVTKETIWTAVGYYCGLAPHRIKAIAAICKAFPPEKRQYTLPFTYYEEVYWGMPDKRQVGKILELADKIRKEEGTIPRGRDIVKLYKEEVTGEPILLRSRIDELIANVAALKEKIPGSSEKIIRVIEILMDVKSTI